MKATDEEIMEALIIYGSVTRAAEALKIARLTIHKRLRNEAFATKLKAKRSENWECAHTKLTDTLNMAIDTMRDILSNNNVAATTRLKAAIAVLDLGLKSQEQLDIITRVEHLEKQLESNKINKK